MTDDRRIQIETAVDTTGARAGFQEIQRQAGSMAAAVARSGQQASQAAEGIGSGASRSAAQVEAAQRNLIGSIQRTSAALEAGTRSGSAYFEVLARQRGVDPAVLEPYLAQLRAVEATQGRATAALAASTPALRSVGVSAAQTAAALRGVPAQFTDIITSLQGGQAPLTVFLQQGGQLKDMFGGIGPAAKALGGYVVGLINPFTVAAGVAVTLGLAYAQGASEAKEYTKQLILSGNAAGTTADQLGNLASKIGKSIGTQGAAAEALAAMVGTSKVSASNLEQFSTVAIRAQRVLGQSVADTASEFSDLAKSPIASLEKLNDKYHFLTGAIYDQVKALIAQGKEYEAGQAAQKAYANAFDDVTTKVTANLSKMERAWISVKDAAKGAWDVIVPRDDSLEVQLEAVRKNIVKASKPFDAGLGGNAEARAQLDVNKRLEQSLLRQISIRDHDAKLDEDKAKFNAADLEWSKGKTEYLTRAQQLEADLTSVQNKGLAAGISDLEIQERLGLVRKKYGDIYNDQIDAQIEKLKQRAAIEDDLKTRASLGIESAKTTGAISDEDAIRSTAALDIAAFDGKKAMLQEELALVKKKQNSEKDQSNLEGQIALSVAQRKTREIQLEYDIIALIEKRRQANSDLYSHGIADAQNERASLLASIQAQKDYSEEIGLSKQEVAQLKAERLEAQAALKDDTAAALDAIEPGSALAQIYRDQAKALRERAGVDVAGADLEARSEVAKKAKDRMDKFMDPSKAQDFGAALREAFGAAGDSISKMDSALKQFGRTQKELVERRKDAQTAFDYGLTTETEHAEQIAAINREDARNRLSMYGDMTQAAAGFFGEQSKGYKALQAASQVFHAAELAMTIAELVPKGISAILTQGSGDPYTAFARIAAMTAIVTGLGVAVGGGSSGGGVAAVDVQKTQGTGSVFGDASAKSESLSRSMDMIEKNTYQGLAYSAGMLVSLRNIESSIGGLGNLIIRSTGVADGTGLNIQTGQINGKGGAVDFISNFGTAVTKGLFGPGLGDKIAGVINNLWGKVTQTIVDSGISFGGPLADLQAGKGYSQYASVDTTKSSFFGLVKNTSNSVQTQALNNELTQQFGMIFANLEDALKQAAVGIGLGESYVTNSLDKFVLEVSTLSLKGLKGDELTSALNAVISKSMDQVSEAAFPAFDKFRKVGEGYSETVLRVANDFIAINTVFESFGKTFGQIGLDSLAARERLIEMSGGLEKFTSQGEYFLDNFFSDAERAAALKNRIQPTLEKYGLSADGDAATRMFRDFVVSLDTTTEAGAQAYAQLQSLAPALIEISKASQKVSDERKGLQDQLDELTLTSTELLEKQRSALDESNRALFDHIQAVKSEKSALEASNKSFADFGTAIIHNIDAAKKAAEAIRDFNDSLALGNLSPLSAEDKYSLAKADLAKVDVRDPEAFKNAVTAFLEASKGRDAGALSFARDYAVANQKLALAASDQDQAAISSEKLLLYIAKQRQIGAFANGGLASGWSMVGERGPELVNFSEPARVYTASQTSGMFGQGGSDNSGLERRVDDLQNTTQRLLISTERTAEILDDIAHGRFIIQTEAAQ